LKGVASRTLAVEVLGKVETDKAFANLALAAAFKKQSLSERDRAFATALVQGVLRHRDQLDEVIAAHSTQPLNKMEVALRNNLRVAIFQLTHMTDIPPSAVVNTATEIGKAIGRHIGISKFVAGLLRGYLRNRDTKQLEPASDAPELSPVERLSKRYSLPSWLVTRWLGQYGEEETVKLLEYSQSVPQLTVRACESGITPEGLANVFEGKGITARKGELVEGCLIIEDRGHCKGPIEKLPGYAEGLFIVQDEAAAFVSQVVDAKPGEMIVDLCAAPGGKTINMAEMMEDTGRVLAVDIQESRLELLKQTCQRVGLKNIEVITADGTTYKPDTKADRVLLDAPCTGTGVINRRSDLRYQRSAPDISRLIELQRKLLDNAANMLKDDGILVYATCSLEPEENEENLKWFLEKHPEFQPDPITPYVPQSFLERDRAAFDRGWIQLIPTRHNVSGFFVARLRKAHA